MQSVEEVFGIDNSGKGLPLSRDERFYTATVLPQIICKNQFEYISVFLNLINEKLQNKVEWPAICADRNRTNIQIFTEYNLKKAWVGNVIKTYGSPPRRFDTPDIVFNIVYPDNTIILIVIEAKLFGYTTTADLKYQVSKQKEVINHLCKNLSTRRAPIHILLLAEQQYKKFTEPLKVPVITWKEIYDKFAKLEDFRNDYFLHILGVALKSYDFVASSAIKLNDDEVNKNVTPDIRDSIVSNLSTLLENSEYPEIIPRYVWVGNTGETAPNYQIEFDDGTIQTFHFSGKPHKASEFQQKNLSERIEWEDFLKL